MPIDILSIGTTSYDIFFPLTSYPQENKKYRSTIIRESGGGPAANAAYLLSKWGVACAFAGLIGDDIYGIRIKKEFEEIGVCTDLLEIRTGYHTPLSCIIINQTNGSRTIINRKLADTLMIMDQTKLKTLNPQILLFDGHELQASLTALDLFPDAISILDAGSLRDETRMLASRVDYLVCSQDFAIAFSGINAFKSPDDELKCLQALFNLNKKNVAITRGEEGVIYLNNGQLKKLPVYKTQTLDTTGAGDVFHGAFAYGLLQHLPLSDNLKFSSIAAALSVAKEGSRDSIPELNEVLTVYKKTSYFP